MNSTTFEMYTPVETYLIDADAFEVAVCAVVIVYSGIYGLRGGDRHMPPLALMGYGVEEFINRVFGGHTSWEVFFDAHKLSIVRALRTVRPREAEPSSALRVLQRALEFADVLEQQVHDSSIIACSS